MPKEGQEELRSILGMVAAHENALRDDISRLLNPRGADLVELSDKQLGREYSIVVDDNYKLLPSSVRDTLVYDAAHGYYVALDVKPLD